eukprot:TRINITY_DN19729_c0_g1_i1.p1 TRINITY_DN19729_c0_g1~~TRINITY_DN19729_c0_g1_i1.p1  ORF type:complete len:505 (-),score=113.27 TRINITY_DN19729_c0_g1_i1:36-1550(-)
MRRTAVVVRATRVLLSRSSRLGLRRFSNVPRSRTYQMCKKMNLSWKPGTTHSMRKNVTINYNSPTAFVRLYSSNYPDHQLLEMPALSPTMETGGIVEWDVEEGEEVGEGDVLATVETDKTNISWTTNDAGYIAKILVEAGTKDIPLGQPCAILVDDEEDVAAFKDFTYEAGAPKEDKPVDAPKAEEPAATPDTTASSKPVAQSTQKTSGGRVVASPLAKKTAKEQGINISNVSGTGPGGRIIQADILEFKPSAAASAAVSAPLFDSPEASYTDIPTSAMRKVIAKRLTESKQQIPHYYLSTDCTVDNLLTLRKQFNDDADGKFKLSVNDFIVKAAALSLKAVPEVNSSWGGDFIRQFNNVDVCVAVQTDDGLFTPFVTDADQKGLVGISSRVKELAEKARAKALLPEEYQGGTFTISNLGMFGVKSFSAVINPPQSSILAVGSTEQRVVVNPKAKQDPSEDRFAVQNVMSVTLSCDHRVVDGAVGARWLQSFKKLMENPMDMLL